MKRILLALVILASIWSPLFYAAIYNTCKQPGEMALTFDYGPGPYTGRLLDVLFEHKIPATFHISTDLLRNLTLAEYVKRAHREGHTIGIFIGEPSSWASYEMLPEDDPVFCGEIIEQITSASNWLTSLTGALPKYIRFGTKKTIGVQLRRIIEQQFGLTITKAKIEIRDESNKMDSIWNSLSKSFANVSPSNHSFILRQRDIIPNSVASVGKIVEFVEGRGFRIVPMLQCVPPRQ